MFLVCLMPLLASSLTLKADFTGKQISLLCCHCSGQHLFSQSNFSPHLKEKKSFSEKWLFNLNEKMLAENVCFGK